MNMVNPTYNSTEDMINNIQSSKGKTKLIFQKTISNYYDNMNIRMNEDHFNKNGQSISEIYHEVLLLMKFSQTKPEVKRMNINFYDLYYTVIKKSDNKETVHNQYEDNENHYISLNDVIMPNHYVRIKGREK